VAAHLEQDLPRSAPAFEVDREPEMVDACSVRERTASARRSETARTGLGLSETEYK
jgi:hypothetical protein